MMRFEKQFASFLGEEKNIDVVKPSKSFAPLLLLLVVVVPNKTEDDDDDAEDEEVESNAPCANPRQREES